MSACPRPEKHAYPSRQIAEQVIRKMPRRKKVGLRPYRCQCGEIHIGRRLRNPVVAWRSDLP